MRAASTRATSAGLIFSAALLALVILHLMTQGPTLRPPGIDPPRGGGGDPGKRHNVARCRRLLIKKNGRLYCEGRDCNYFVPEDEVIDNDPLGA
ncbi:hypothetical protein [Spirilliplanes yamanashiensis]|uniref:Uncharacterized protein n=1 Tax=Spirilliplanes yamanashiensis TaxID=42233 RepID=A0A8J3YEC4_9ACTN|nr:hypothetical protein [Spirilliplanes yamanashiensis]MDP9818494.1 hypothetical protein [Spirilliplanes yamanashiensis]GIJ06380.1 hypothetical protein Sya03_57320 [Spirilliplanes yamanashiensis]